MLYKHYSNINILDDIETIEEFIEMYKILYKEETDEKLYQLYLINYQHMTKETYKTYDEWLGNVEVKQKEKAKKSVDDILKDVALILKAR